MSHYNIPIFIPELACPHRCVFCNQEKISGRIKAPKVEEVENIIEEHLSTIDWKNNEVQIAFFGGSFTGIDLELQNQYLSTAHKYISEKKVSGIRISTRPDYISEDILNNLKSYGVNSIELGAQTLDKDVLIKAGRGHSLEDVFKASKLIKEFGFELGLQMMLGLPGDSKEKSILTAQKIIELKADTTRIYPTLVIEDTALARMYREGKYKVLTVEEAVDWTKDILQIFENSNVTVLRTGLHPSDEFENGTSLLAGPYHPAFKELVLTEIWSDNLKNIKPTSSNIEIIVNPRQLNYAIGFKKKNKNELLKHFKNVKFSSSDKLNKNDYEVVYC